MDQPGTRPLAADQLQWENGGGSATLTATVEDLARIRGHWSATGQVVIAANGRILVVRQRPGAVWVHDGVTQDAVAEVGRRRRRDVVWLPDGRLLRWLTPSRLCWECGFAEYDRRSRRIVRNLVLFDPNALGLVVGESRPLTSASDGQPPLCDTDLLLALGWLLIVFGRAGRGGTSLLARMGRWSPAVVPDRRRRKASYGCTADTH